MLWGHCRSAAALVYMYCMQGVHDIMALNQRLVVDHVECHFWDFQQAGCRHGCCHAIKAAQHAMLRIGQGGLC